MSVAERFQKALELANPTNAQTQEAVAGHTAIRQVLDGEGATVKSFLHGSYARNTSNNPLHDVDMIQVINSKLDAEAALRQTANLSNLPGAQIRGQAHSVGVTFKGKLMSFDIVPAIPKAKWTGRLDEYDGGFEVPDKKEGLWITSFPLHAQREVQRANAACNNRLVPLIRLLKCWNEELRRRNDWTKKLFKSFHLEIMCYSVALQSRSNSRQDFARLLRHLANTVSQPVSPPRGGQPFQITRLMHPCLLEAAQQAEAAVKFEGSMVQLAHAKWRELLGNLY